MARNRSAENAEKRNQLLPVYTVDLDAGVFNWLNEIVHARARAASPGVKVTIPSYDELLKRAVATFDAAARQHDETPEPPKRRTVKRRVVEQPEPQPVRRGIKRRPR